VTIIGGGPVGIELAGEIVEAFGTSKQVTLVHKEPQLVNGNLSGRFRDRVRKAPSL